MGWSFTCLDILRTPKRKFIFLYFWLFWGVTETIKKTREKLWKIVYGCVTLTPLNLRLFIQLLKTLFCSLLGLRLIYCGILLTHKMESCLSLKNYSTAMNRFKGLWINSCMNWFSCEGNQFSSKVLLICSLFIFSIVLHSQITSTSVLYQFPTKTMLLTLKKC